MVHIVFRFGEFLELDTIGGGSKFYSLDSLPPMFGKGTHGRRFLGKMVRSKVRRVSYLRDFIEVCTFVSDSTYDELKAADPTFYDRWNWDLEDRDPECPLAYTFLILDKAKSSRRQEIIWDNNASQLHQIVGDSVIWFRSCF